MKLTTSIERARADATAHGGTWCSDGPVAEKLTVPQARERQLALLDIASAVTNERAARRAFMGSPTPKNRRLLLAWQAAGDATDLALQAFHELVDSHVDSGRITDGAP